MKEPKRKKKYWVDKKGKKGKKFRISDDIKDFKGKKFGVLDFVPEETTSLTIGDIVFTRKPKHYAGITYLTDNNTKYSFSYQELKDDFHKFKDMKDEEFIANALSILHFCCVVSYIKDLPSHAVLIDDGVIHELVHLLSDETRDGAIENLPEIRKNFNSIMELA